MSSLSNLFAILRLVAFPLGLATIAGAHPNHLETSVATEPQSIPEPPPAAATGSSRGTVLVISLTVFVLAVFVGFEIIAKVPPTLHTPLMSGSNAISGITVVGAIIAAGFERTDFATILGVLAVILANINVVGGFVVTHRMLLMFKKR